ncbi:UV-endonuclease UvdE-domain-containing protein [Dactylonectria macrodidyma]|uniref:UV-endonuclease UvdE-domain-containing protein n=1 Tax=Dactylonectria macrodidyma TaxID=307937 RepID=A0A9P9FME0_9HYPO|nr:UV-endonuclease UvdE-domain-containing protein [Dactylonectria macrodidyma]
MPSKRKRAGEHPPPPYCDGPRRSVRNSKAQSNASDEAYEASDKDADPVVKAQPKGLWESKEGVQQARRQLSEMEHKLKSAVRKQRLAVQNSEFNVELASSRQVGIHHVPPLPIQTKNKPDSKQQPVEPTPSDTDQAEVVTSDIDAEPDIDGVKKGADRPPPVNSDILPLPWSGRLGYACLNTYLRAANPPVFSSRTCRIASILEHRYPLCDPSQPEHPTKNRPDKTQTPSVERGQKFVQELGLANARDIVKMLRWNDKYGIKFMRLSSEMFPFASHQEHGYKLAPFASETLAEAGRVAVELNHRLTTHPGQFTQIGSPRTEVVAASFRDLEYHEEMLSLLKLPEQPDRDAVMIIHMGGTYGDKAATLERFRKNYAELSDGVKRRLVLENDDVAWSVHDLLPVCEELNIPLVLDFHHHNIVFDPCMREGTLGIIELFEHIKKTWTRKGITQKMHYSEPVRGAVTPHERRKHSARVKALPPCATDMDLMIEAKDKEQAVFELMRTFKLPGWDRFNDMVPHEREDEPRKAIKKKPKKGKKKTNGSSEDSEYGIEIPERTKFLQWFQSLPGATFSDAIKIVDLRDRNAGRGIIAAQDIAPETTLFTIPRQAIINTLTSELPKKLPDVFDIEHQMTEDDEDSVPPMDAWSSLILVMIYEYLQGDKSSWKPYFDVLPSTFDTPMFWSEEELNQLQSSHMRSKIGKVDAEEMFQGRILPIIRQNAGLFPSSESKSDRELVEVAHRMGSTIMAYAFDLEKDEDADEGDEVDGWVEDRDANSMMGMVPMADILNADAEFNAHVNHEDSSLTVISLRPIKAGEEILNYYGPHPNSELLRRYGYVTERHSRYDVVEIPWDVVESAMTTHFGIPNSTLEKLRAELEEEEEFEDTFVLERETGEVNSDGTFSGPANFEGMPEDLQQQLKVFLKGVKKAQPEAIPDKRKRDEIQQAVQAKTLQSLVSRYSTSIFEDELLLKSNGLAPRARMAVEVRLGEKKLLREAIAALSSDDDVEMTLDEESGPSKRAKRSG